MTSSPYRLRCLGGLFVAPEHTALGQRKRLILLAILAYAGRSGISKERVESFLWPESDGQRARNGLYQLVFGIRRELGEGAIVSVNNELRLGVDVLTSDIGEFRHAIESGDLEGAIGCYAGSFLDGVQGRESAELDQWIEVARRELEARYHETLECLSVRASLAGRRDDAVRWTRKRAVSEPLSTRAAIAHIRALDAVGDRAASLLFAQDLVTGTARLVTRAEFQPTSVSWSPDGKLLAYVVGTGSMMNIAPSSIWLVAPWGGKPVRITDLIHLNTSPVFAPDSRSLLYVSNRDGVRDIYQQSIGHGVQAAGDAVRLSIGSNAVTISLSGDGTRMSYGVLNMRSNLWSAPITVGGHPPDSSLRALTSGNQEVECLSVTDDGRWLIFDSNKGGNQDIYRMPVGGGEAVQLTNDAADDFCGKASPDGKEIAFYSMRDQGRRRIHTMRVDGTRQRALPATTGHAWSPTWSRDGNRIAFTSNSNGHDEIYVVARRPDGDWTGPRLLASVVGAGHSVVWSPDDKYIAAGTDSSIVLLPTRAADPRISIDLPPDHEHFVGPGMTALAKWGPDPTKLYIRRPGGPGVIGEFWIASLSGGAPRLALKLDTAKVISRRGEFATDGKRIFFTLATDEANVWLMELKR